MGVSLWQGVHQEAKKFTTRGLPEKRAKDSVPCALTPLLLNSGSENEGIAFPTSADLEAEVAITPEVASAFPDWLKVAAYTA